MSFVWKGHGGPRRPKPEQSDVEGVLTLVIDRSSRDRALLRICGFVVLLCTSKIKCNRKCLFLDNYHVFIIICRLVTDIPGTTDVNYGKHGYVHHV